MRRALASIALVSPQGPPAPLAKAPLVTTIVDKFRALTRKRFEDRDENVYILVDESHRSQYGDDESFHADMRRAFPRASASRALTKKERNTFVEFGDLVGRAEPRRRVLEADAKADARLRDAEGGAGKAHALTSVPRAGAEGIGNR